MAALYAIISPAPEVSGPTFGVVSDDTQAHYVFTQGSELDGLDDARIAYVAGLSAVPVNDAASWLGVACSNVGYVQVSDATSAPDLETAVKEVLAAIQATPTVTAAGAPEPDLGSEWSVPATRDELMQFQRDATYEWEISYPEAAAGDVNDPEANLALAQLMTPPVDPTRPHAWLPIASTETDCGFCEQPADAAIHAANADTITRGSD